MKRTSITMCIILVLSACRPKYAPFVQRDIRIVPPIKQTGDEYVEARFINDGGTTWLTIVDATQKAFVEGGGRLNNRAEPAKMNP